MDIRRLLKVYNTVNDEKRSRLNIKFVGVFAAFLLSVVAFAGFFALQRGGSDACVTDCASSAASQREYVGLSSGELASPVGKSALVEQRWQSWEAEHRDAVVEKRESVEVGGVVVGYWVTYREP